MANTPDVGKINEGVILSAHEDKISDVNSNGSRNGFTLPSRLSYSKSHAAELDDTDEKDSTIWYCRFVATRTRLAFGIVLGAHILMLILTAVLTVFGYDVINIEFGRLPLELPEDSTKLRTDAWWFAKDSLSISSTKGDQLQRSVRYQTLAMVYESKDGNVFTKENLRAIERSENAMFELKDYQDKLCQLEQKSKNMTCKQPLSIIRFFDGSYRNIHKNFYDPNFENISSVLYTAQSLNVSRAILNFHLDKNAVIEKKVVSSRYTRSLMYTGWPHEGYPNTNDNEEEQAEKLNKITVDIFSTILEKKYEDGVGEMNFYYNNLALRADAIFKQVVLDMMLAIASFVFIFFFSWFHTGSLWITLWGIFSIISSFNITNLIYGTVFDFRYFGIFHILSIFIILGIGCDDIFIFMDTWKQSSKDSHKNLAQRLTSVYKSAAKTTFVTSFTTMAAFLSNMQSPLLAIYSFGLFSALLIVVNYLSIIIFFPVVLILHHKSRKGKICCARIKHQERQNANSKKISQYVIEFFEGWFFKNIITHKVVRWVVIVCFTALAVVSIFYATKLEANKEQIQLWRTNTNWNQIRDIESNKFRESQEDRVLIVHIIWGLHEQDRSECHHTDFKCKGKTVLDLKFDLNPPSCQNAMLEFCEEMKNIGKEDEQKLHLRRSQVTGDIEIECIFQRMNEFLTEETNKTKYATTSVNFSFPLNEKKIEKLMVSNPDVYKVLPSEKITKFFEVGAGYFMSQGGRKDYSSSFDYTKYKDYIEGVIYPQSFNNISQENKYNGRLAYVAIALNTTVNPRTLPYEKGLKIYDNWEDFVNKKMTKLPPSCNDGFQATVTRFNTWEWLKVQKQLVRNAITGIVIGLILSLVILTIATTNVIIGVMATLTIAFVTCGVLAVISIVGWSLGVLESLNLTLIVGLAVDYVVHLAEGYMMLEDEDRATRVKYTLGHVGISVFSGACTTLGSSIFMLAAKILFFSQFGIFIFCTISFSILYSLFFFTTVLALMGPEGNTGSLRPIMRKIKKLVCCKDEDDVNPGRAKNRVSSNDLGNGAVIVTKL